jgi:hypothetical protein
MKDTTGYDNGDANDIKVRICNLSSPLRNFSRNRLKSLSISSNFASLRTRECLRPANQHVTAFKRALVMASSFPT